MVDCSDLAVSGGGDGGLDGVRGADWWWGWRRARVHIVIGGHRGAARVVADRLAAHRLVADRFRANADVSQRGVPCKISENLIKGAQLTP